MASETLYCMECVEGRPVALGLCADCLAGEPLEEVIRQIARLSRELSEAREQIRRLREALERVADGGCERFYGTDCWQMGMAPHATDYVDRVCDPCFARRALVADTEVSDAE